MTLEPGNIGMPTILNIWEPGNTATPTIFEAPRQTGERTGGRVGRVREKRSGKAQIWEHVPGKHEHGNLGNKIETNAFLKMAPQAKPLCS